MLLTLALWAVVAAAQDFSIPLHRREVSGSNHHALSSFARRQSGVEPNVEHKTFYWFGNYTVGDSHDLELLIDTGSPFIFVNPGLYKPSTHARPVPKNKRNFNLTYEGINKAGTGFETVYATVGRDLVSAGGLKVLNQGFGNVTNFTVQDAPPLKSAFQGDGIIGFSYASNQQNSSTPLLPTWVSNLCYQKLISQCRFALAYGTNFKGVQVVGKVAKKLFNGALTVAPLDPKGFGGWTTRADVTLNGKYHFPNQSVILDCGTSNMQAPLDVARKMFKVLGYPYKTTVGGPNPFVPSENVTFITATFPCDKPPTLTFSFPAKVDLDNRPSGVTFSQKSKSFDLLSSEWSVHNNGNNNCTAVLSGTNALTDPDAGLAAWLIGQPFYQGHYVDHNLDGTLGFADLVNPGNVAGS